MNTVVNLTLLHTNGKNKLRQDLEDVVIKAVEAVNTTQSLKNIQKFLLRRIAKAHRNKDSHILTELTRLNSSIKEASFQTVVGNQKITFLLLQCNNLLIRVIEILP